MFGIFAILSTAVLAALVRQRLLSLWLIVFALVCAALMLYHHATEILKINW